LFILILSFKLYLSAKYKACAMHELVNAVYKAVHV
jgi:hypothetical protein